MPRVYTTGPPKNADAIENALKAERRAVPVGVKAAAEPIQRYLELKVNIPYPPPSAPGQPAHRRTGKYKRGWNVKAKALVLTIKNPVKYAGFLEFGTRKMKARPALTKSKGGGGGGGKNNGGAGNPARYIRQAGKTAADTARRLPQQRTHSAR